MVLSLGVLSNIFAMAIDWLVRPSEYSNKCYYCLTGGPAFRSR